MKDIIDQLLPSIISFAELENVLKQKGYKTYIKRAIAFFNTKNSMKVKGSEIGRGYSLANLERRLGREIVVEKKQEINKQWNTSQSGNSYLRIDSHYFLIFKDKQSNKYKYKLDDHFYKKMFETIDDAKKASFKTMERLKEYGEW